MQDPRPLAALKLLVRLAWTAELWWRRRLRPARTWVLGGACEGCARCCETPTIRTGRLLWLAPSLRWLFLWWQRRVNGFELIEADRRARAFVFRCTHFDTQTRRCDSYASRPFMCRDYPRALLHQAWPELFEGCGFRIIAADADRQRRALSDAALSDAGLSEEQQAELRRRMRLE